MRIKRWLAGIGITVAVLAVVAAGLYLFGGMQPPSAEARAAYAADVAAGGQPAVDARFVISIPGCVCHTDDPVLQVQHSVRRMSECGGCHTRG
jgi:alkanesulfonate monooxygenase SsuD/methylene tetrahydromethanopterin reductase-like flavin-dependent oxidoreductase (luciferase family)